MPRDFENTRWNIRNFPGAAASRTGKGQWFVFCLVAVLAGILILVLATVGFVIALVCVVVFSLIVALRSKGTGVVSRRREDSADSGKPCSGSVGKCVELDKDEYTVRVIDENTRPPV